jgi:heme exporter protein D
MSLAEFFHMGGYAFYVWTAYGLAAVVIIANIWVPLRCQRSIREDILRRARRVRRSL